MRIIDYPNYHIFRNGSVLSERRKGAKAKFLKPFIHEDYKSVFLQNNGKRKRFPIHRLLAIHFIPNPNNYECIDHKDGNKLNNSISNLRWCSRSMNRSYNNHKLQKNNKSGYRGICITKYKGKNKTTTYYSVQKKGITNKSFKILQEAIDYLNKFKME